MLSELGNNINSIFSRNLAVLSIYIVIAFIFSFVVGQSIDLFFEKLKRQSRLETYKKRINTIRSLLQNVTVFTIFTILLLVGLNTLGVNITPILTGAGIIGLGFSLGSQTLIKDVIAGFFIIVEDQYNVGDAIQIGDKKGYVYKITLRVTVLIDENESLIYIPNSQIAQVVVFRKDYVIENKLKPSIKPKTPQILVKK